MRDRIVQWLSLQKFEFLVPHYGVMLTLALIVGAWMTVRRCRRQGLPEGDAYQAVFYALLLVFAGGRLIYSLQYFHEFSKHPWELLDPRHGGIALYGGLLGLVLGPILYLRSRRLSIGPYFDATVPALAIGLFFGRIGCFLAGCNWGKMSNLPWAVRFPPPRHAYAQHLKAGLIAPGAPLSLPVHPTQLYEAGFGLLMFVLSLWWLSRVYPALWQPSKWQRSIPLRLPAFDFRSSTFDLRPGRIFLLAISCYAIFRFSIEFLRADSYGWRLGVLTVAQGISIATFGICLLLLFKDGRRRAQIGEGNRRREGTQKESLCIAASALKQ